MLRIGISYALLLVAAAFALDWLGYRYLVRAFPVEIYVTVIATGFAALGVWVGWRLARRPAPVKFEANDAARAALSITAREHQVLTLVAKGSSNKEIARELGVSPNTVKSQLASLYQKLGAGRRTLAVQKARELALIP